MCRLCTEVGLLDSNFTTRGADIVYARVKDRFARKIGYLGFLDALCLVATKKEIGVGEVVLEVRTCETPAVRISVRSAGGLLQGSRCSRVKARVGGVAAKGKRATRLHWALPESLLRCIEVGMEVRNRLAGAGDCQVLTAGPAMDPKTKRTKTVKLPPELRHIFSVYDVNGNGTLDRIEVSYIFADLKLLNGFPNNEGGEYLDTEYKNIDSNHDGTVCMVLVFCLTPGPRSMGSHRPCRAVAGERDGVRQVLEEADARAAHVAVQDGRSGQGDEHGKPRHERGGSVPGAAESGERGEAHPRM